MAQVTAQLNYFRISPRKVRAVAEVIRGMDIEDARNQLDYILRRPSSHLLKLLNSAVANAKNNLSMVEDNLFIKDVVVNEGVTLKRFKPKGFGQAAPIHKKTSHIKIILEEKKPGLRSEKIKEKVETKPIEEKKGIERKEFKKDNYNVGRDKVKKMGKKSVFSGIKDVSRKLFRRKSI